MEIKQGQIEEIFRKFSNTEILPILPSPEIFRYRNKMEFSCGYESMKTEIKDDKRVYYDEGFGLGFHPEGNWSIVMNIEDALIASEEMNGLRKICLELMKSTKEKPRNPKIHSGFWRGVIFRQTKSTGEVQINFIVAKAKTKMFWARILDSILESAKEQNIKISGILQTAHEGKSEAINNPEIKVLYGKETFEEKLEEFIFEVSPFSFFQTNTLGAEILYKKIREFVGEKDDLRILDLFCGTGSIGIFCSEKAKEIVGIEMVEEAVEMAKRNAEKNGVKNTTFYAGKAEKVLYEIPDQEFDVAIIDPPRSGIHPKALKFITTKLKAKHLVFVSCNPATLARDLEYMESEGWKTKKLQTVDMFPHTPHMECVSLLGKG